MARPADVGDAPDCSVAVLTDQQRTVGRDGDVILVFLAFVGDAEPPGLGLLELAQSPNERDVPVVGVALDTMRQMESQMMMRSYEGFLR